MKKLTHLQEQIVKLLLYNPGDAFNIIRKTTNPGYTTRYLNSLIPYRIGVEIDAAGYTRKVHNQIREFHRNNGLHDYLVDYGDDIDKGSANEIRISCSNLRHYKNFFKALQILNNEERITLDSRGGLHIHVSLTDCMRVRGVNENEVSETAFIENLYKIENWERKIDKYFFYLNNTVAKSKYAPKHTKRQDGRVGTTKDHVALHSGAAIIVLRNKISIEYRIMQPTFDYTAIMRSALVFQQMNKSLIHNTPFNKELCDNFLRL